MATVSRRPDAPAWVTAIRLTAHLPHRQPLGDALHVDTANRCRDRTTIATGNRK